METSATGTQSPEREERELPSAPPHPRRRLSTPRLTVTPLRDYQKRNTTTACREVKDGGRATIEMTCGTGKTAVSAECARRLARNGRVLVVVPRIELLEQTAEAWTTRHGRRGYALAACSRDEALERAEAGGHIEAQVTTNAAEIADLLAAAGGSSGEAAAVSADKGQAITVYATYASLERLVQAHADFGLAPWDLVIVDEAHHTAGAIDKPWAAVHDDDKIPALRRLYFTATPSIAASRPGTDDLSDLVVGKAPTLYSMDDERTFGKIVARYGYTQAVNEGWVADYRVLVPVVTDEDLAELLMLPAVADLRSQRTNEDLQRLALQVAVLRAIASLGLRRVITFHSRVTAARKFSDTLLETADLLVDKARQAAGDPLADYARPERLWTAAIAGTDRLKDRRDAFGRFSAHTGEDGEECGVLCNARLLGEGIDIPAVDAVVFADPKSSPIDIVQAFGRAVRQKPQQGKIAYIIIPVYLPAPSAETGGIEADDLPSADPMDVVDAGQAVQVEADEAINASPYKTILQVLRALASVDSRVVGRITELRTHRAAGPLTAPETRSRTAASGEEDEALLDEEPQESPIEWLRIDATAHQQEILQALKLRAFSPRAQEWERQYKAAAAFYAEHGHLDVTDKQQYGELITWLDQQRYLNASDGMDPARRSELDSIGMIWDKRANAWDRGMAYALAFHRKHGHLAMPTDHRTGAFADGQWMRRQRKNPDALTAEQRSRLDNLDPLWRQSPDWNRSARRYAAYLAAGGTVQGPVNRPGLANDPDFRPGKWQAKQLRATQEGTLDRQQVAVLRFLGILPGPTSAEGPTHFTLHALPPAPLVHGGDEDGEADL
ncbi:Helicase associated domain protein [Kitasatospora sp. NPDC048296]|uniref:DEAD/DEAH box helicase n=1 Tax=Kitasatospora sp. NPDC048296 TaxID=3364048 RepID=UPI0037167DE0